MRFESLNFPCSSCGAPTKYSPATGLLSCAFCGASSQIISDNRQIKEYDLAQALAEVTKSTPVEITKDINCPKCGAGFALDPHIASTTCPYCETPVITEFVNSIVAESILPFIVTQKKAKSIFASWIGSLWFAPSELKHFVDSDKQLRGCYLPYWCYDANTDTSYQGERGDIYYVTVQRREVINGKEQTVSVQEQRIAWSSVSGRVDRYFDDLNIPANSSIPQQVLDNLSPWDTSTLKPFDKRYLSGFESEEYTINIDSGFDSAKYIMSGIIQSDIRRDIGGDQQRIFNMDTRYSSARYKNTLFPVWTTHFKYRGKEYAYAINGQSGKVTGERPYSYTKIAILVGSIAIGIALTAYYYQIYN